MRSIAAPPTELAGEGTGVEPEAAPRPLRFTGLRLAGFKSFSDPVELAIEGGLTGIVGPNGCGKSNIVEALRWVMGESSAKGLRGAEMADVIFNGTGSRPGFDVAEVRLKLDAAVPQGRERALELEIARRIARGQGSVYRLNGREVRARDVQLLFADAGAGARSPAIVGQGQVGFIVEAGPAERRRLLEDAAGIGGLHGRRREAEAKLRETRANLQRVTDLLASQETHLADLERQDRQAARYRELAAELREAEALLLLFRLRRATAALEAAEAGLATAIGDDAKAQDDLAALREGRRAGAEALTAVRARLAAVREEAATLRERRANFEAGMVQRRAHRAALERAATDAAAEIERQEAVSAQHSARATAAAQAEAAAASERSAVEAMLPALREASGVAARRRDDTEAMWREAAASTAELERDRVHADESLRSLDAKAEATRRDLAALPSLSPAAAGNTEDEEKEVGRARALVAEGEAALQAAEAHLEAARAAVAPAAAALERATADMMTIDAEIAALEGEARVRHARQQDLERQQDQHARRRRALAERQALYRDSLIALDPAGAMARCDAADVALAEADTALDRVRTAVALAEGEEQAAHLALREVDRALDALGSEIKVLGELAIDLPPDAVLRDVHIPAELERAVAAALGDDLLASSDPQAHARWCRLPRELGTDPLPEGATPLAGLIEAPDLLADRIERVGIVDGPVTPSLQASLRPGQRLVARDGTVWRWDGLVREGDAETQGAARLRHRLRLDAAQAERQSLEAERVGCAVRCAAGAARSGEARAALAAAQSAWREADAAQLRAAQALLAVEEAQARLAGEAAALADLAAALELEAGDLAAAAAALGADPTAALRDLQARREQVVRLRDDRRAAHATAVAAAQRCEGERAACAEAWRQALAAQLAAQGALESRRREMEGAARAAAAAAADRAARRETLAADLAYLEVERANLVAAAAQVAERARAAATAGELGSAELVAARADADAATGRLAEAEDDLAALARREQDAAAAGLELADQVARTAEQLEMLRARCRRLEAELAALPAEQGDAAGDGLAAEMRRLDSEAEAAAHAMAAAETGLGTVEADLAAAEASALAAREAAALAQAARDRARVDHDAAQEAATRLPAAPADLLADQATVQALETTTEAALGTRAARLRTTRDQLGPVNLRAATEAGELRAALERTRADEAELRAAVGRLEAAIARLNREGRERLGAVFADVDDHFGRLFGRLFGGGRAQLRLVGADDPLEAGLELEACPPGKKLTSIGLLSGGEKTLTALALVFAFFLAAPSPLCVLDEVDAPLDDANVERFVSLMREIAADSGTRFLVVTHHPLTMARTDRLYGVTMSERGVSRLVSVALEEAVSMHASA